MTEDVLVAYRLLQEELSRTAVTDHWRAEQIEEALSDLLANPERQGAPRRLVTNALSHARKKLVRRSDLAASSSASLAWCQERTTLDGEYIARREALDILGSMSERDKRVLSLAFIDTDAEEAAAALGMPTQRYRERLSRARARARHAAAA